MPTDLLVSDGAFLNRTRPDHQVGCHQVGCICRNVPPTHSSTHWFPQANSQAEDSEDSEDGEDGEDGEGLRASR